MSKTSTWARLFIAKKLGCKPDWHNIVATVVNLQDNYRSTCEAFDSLQDKHLSRVYE